MYQYFNPYAANMQQNVNQYQTQPQQIVKVSGEPGARAYQMPANSSVLLLDEQQPVVWLKTTDGAGYPNITPYVISPKQEEKHPDIRSLEARISRLEGMMNNESYYTNVTTASDEQPIIPDISNKRINSKQKRRNFGKNKKK